ncbi:hypothetical protein JCM8097_004769 [Rhodosporidiobolus ruineniae]
MSAHPDSTQTGSYDLQLDSGDPFGSPTPDFAVPRTLPSSASTSSPSPFLRQSPTAQRFQSSLSLASATGRATLTAPSGPTPASSSSMHAAAFPSGSRFSAFLASSRTPNSPSSHAAQTSESFERRPTAPSSQGAGPAQGFGLVRGVRPLSHDRERAYGSGVEGDDGAVGERRYSFGAMSIGSDGEVPLEPDEGGASTGGGGWFGSGDAAAQQQEPYGYVQQQYQQQRRQPLHLDTGSGTVYDQLQLSSSSSSGLPLTVNTTTGGADVGGDLPFSFGYDSPVLATVKEEQLEDAFSPGDGNVSPAVVEGHASYFASPPTATPSAAAAAAVLFGSSPMQEYGRFVPHRAEPQQQQQYFPPTIPVAYGAHTSAHTGEGIAIPASRRAYSVATGSGSQSFSPSSPGILLGPFLPSSSSQPRSITGAVPVPGAPSSPYQPFAFSPSSTSLGGGVAPASLESASSLSAAAPYAEPSPSLGSVFASSPPSNFAALSAPSYPVFPSSSSGFGSGQRRASYAPTVEDDAAMTMAPPSPPRSSGSILAGAFSFPPTAAAAAYLHSHEHQLYSPHGEEHHQQQHEYESPASEFGGFFSPAPTLHSPPVASSSSSAYDPLASSPSSFGRAPSRSHKSSSSKRRSPPSSGGTEDPRLRHRPISPITGKPTKVIAKRGWPPKDADKRVYRCEVEGCGKSFGRPSARDTHMRSHNGIKPFVCPIPSCGRAFSVFSNLKRHMIVHPTVDFRQVSVNDLPLIRWVDDPLDPGGAGGRLEWVEEEAVEAAAGVKDEEDEESGEEE